MAIIKAVLFRSLEFQATEESLIRLKQTNIASLAPFVKKLIFLPTYNSKTLDLPEFAAVVRNIADHKQELLDSDSDELENVKQYITTRWHGEVPVSNENEEMSDAFDAFAQSVYIDEKLMIDGAFKDTWLDCFLKFPGLNSISLRTPLLYHPFNPSWVHGNGTYVTQCMGCVDSVDTLGKDFGSGGFHIFDTVAQCMLAAPSRILNLSIEWELLVTLFANWERQAWKDLTLDHLKRLTIRNAVNNIDLQVHDAEDFTEVWKLSVEALLEKSPASLEELEIYCCCQYPQMEWPAIRCFGLILLRQLSIGGVIVDPGSFAQDIAKLDNLEKLRVAGCDIDVEGSSNSWKAVFDALRDHQPQLKHISFLSMDLGELAYNPWEVTVTEDDFEAQKPPPTIGDDTESVMLEYNLCLYISKWGN